MRHFYGATLAAAFLLTHATAHAQTREDLTAPKATAPFPPEVYAARRAALMEKLGGGVVIIHSADAVGEHGARQDANFAYLTGITDEAGAILMLFPGGPDDANELLFLQPYQPENDIWLGERARLGEALAARTGFDKVWRKSRISRYMTNIAKDPILHYLGPIVGPDAPLPKSLEYLQKIAARIPGARIENQWELLPAMRSRKEPREIALMKEAIKATIAGHKAGMSTVRPGMGENELQHAIESGFKAQNAYATAFPSIVGSGPNSAILHYERNDRVIEDGDVIVVDIGAEYRHYASDITRTYPANGRFTARQREVYELVLKAQRAAEAKLKAGAHMRADLQAAAERVLRQAGHVDDFPHGLGHFVGLRVHDLGDYLEPLPEGAIITIEPGVYLPDEGFGVRIEDMYLVTKNGFERLTADLPRTSEEVEAFMAAARR